MKIGDLLKELRLQHNYTQQAVADKIGISRSVLSQYENNIVEPTAYVVAKCATFYEVSTDYLLGLEDDFGAPTATMEESLTREERELIEKYRELNAPGRKLIDTTMNTLLSASEESKRKGINYDKY